MTRLRSVPIHNTDPSYHGFGESIRSTNGCESNGSHLSPVFASIISGASANNLLRNAIPDATMLFVYTWPAFAS